MLRPLAVLSNCLALFHSIYAFTCIESVYERAAYCLAFVVALSTHIRGFSSMYASDAK